MTLDEAIQHCLDVANSKEIEAEFETDYVCYFMTDKEREECKECAADHRQLAEWLTELKEAKRLLKAAVEDLNVTVAEVYRGDVICKCCKWKSQIGECCCPDDGGCDTDYRWRYADETERLINS